MPLEFRRPLYLVFKEAVNNVARHSGGRTATIVLEATHKTFKLTIEDDGRGFDPSASYPGEGLVSIARRVGEMGGAVRWESRPGQGTRFTCSLPLAAPRKPHIHVGDSRPPSR